MDKRLSWIQECPPGGDEVPVRREGHATVVTLRDLGVHAMLIAESIGEPCSTPEPSGNCHL